MKISLRLHDDIVGTANGPIQIECSDFHVEDGTLYILSGEGIPYNPHKVVSECFAPGTWIHVKAVEGQKFL